MVPTGATPTKRHGYEGFGVYSHYKGGMYLVYGVAAPKDCPFALRDPLIVYADWKDDGLYIRPQSSFDEMVDEATPRFQKIVY